MKMLFNEPSESSTNPNQANNSKPHDSFPVFNKQSHNFSQNKLSQNSDLIHKQSDESESLNTDSPVSSLSVFNKNFTTFMKYSDSNLDINMAVSSSNSNINNKLNDSNYTMADVVKSEVTSTSKEIRLNDMLAATSLTKDSTMLDSTDNQKYSSKT